MKLFLVVLLLLGGCSAVPSLLPSGKQAIKARKTVDLLAGCYMRLVETCKTAYKTEKGWLGSKKTPYKACKTIQVQTCPGDPEYRADR